MAELSQEALALEKELNDKWLQVSPLNMPGSPAFQRRWAKKTKVLKRETEALK